MGALIYFIIAAAITVLIASILGIRYLLNQRRIHKAMHFVQAGHHAEAFQLYLKALKFNVATKKGSQLLESIIGLYKANGLAENDVNKMRVGYEAISQRFIQQKAELDEQKISSNKKLNRIAEISKEAGKEIDVLFVQFPKLQDRT